MRNRFVVVACCVVASAALWAANPRALGEPTLMDRAFVEELFRATAAQVVAGELCVQRCQAANVRNHGQTMVDSHTRAAATLTPLMTARGVMKPVVHRPTDLERRLVAATPEQFDSVYLSGVAAAHQRLVMLLEREMRGGNDPVFQKLARDLLPAVVHHQASAAELEKGLAGVVRESTQEVRD